MLRELVRQEVSAWWKRMRCTLSFGHIDPPVILVAQQIFVCKKCGKVLR